jgi:hypothetical protein
MEAAVVGQNLGGDREEFRDTNRYRHNVYGSFSVSW